MCVGQVVTGSGLKERGGFTVRFSLHSTVTPSTSTAECSAKVTLNCQLNHIHCLDTLLSTHKRGEGKCVHACVSVFVCAFVCACVYV